MGALFSQGKRLFEKKKKARENRKKKEVGYSEKERGGGTIPVAMPDKSGMHHGKKVVRSFGKKGQDEFAGEEIQAHRKKKRFLGKGDRGHAAKTPGRKKK